MNLREEQTLSNSEEESTKLVLEGVKSKMETPKSNLRTMDIENIVYILKIEVKTRRKDNEKIIHSQRDLLCFI